MLFELGNFLPAENMSLESLNLHTRHQRFGVRFKLKYYRSQHKSLLEPIQWVRFGLHFGFLFGPKLGYRLI
jgi:hypothetical protein